MAGKESGTARLMVSILGLALVGAVLVAYLWETLNRLMSLHFEPVRLLIAIPVLLLFLFLLRLIRRIIGRWEGEPQV